MIVFIPRKHGVIKMDLSSYLKLRVEGWRVATNKASRNYDYIRVLINTGKHPKNYQSKVLSRYLLDAPNELYVDHINHNPLDNTFANLRLATRSENGANRRKRVSSKYSIYKGVSFDKKKLKKKWRAQITVRKKRIFLGYFLNEEDAARAYNQAAIEFFGKFSHINKLT